jgi:hypothetical protein
MNVNLFYEFIIEKNNVFELKFNKINLIVSRFSLDNYIKFSKRCNFAS